MQKNGKLEDSNSAFRVHEQLKAVVFNIDLIMSLKRSRLSRLFFLFKDFSEMYNEEMKKTGDQQESKHNTSH